MEKKIIEPRSPRWTQPNIDGVAKTSGVKEYDEIIILIGCFQEFVWTCVDNLTEPSLAIIWADSNGQSFQKVSIRLNI